MQRTLSATWILSLAFCFFFLLAITATAHEVYVLPQESVDYAMTQPPLQMIEIIYANAGEFFFWLFIVLLTLLTVASISVSKLLEGFAGPMLRKLKPYAPLVARVTLGSAVITSGWAGAMFGPELGFDNFLSPASASILAILLSVLGALITIGLFTRIASMILVLVYFGMWTQYGTYMLTYLNYLGLILLVLIAGNATLALDRAFHNLYPNILQNLLSWCEDRAFLILRVAFGFSLIFASFYAKFLHAELALQTVIEYDLTRYFPFEPSFLVLGAFAIELLLGFFIMLGLEVRFVALFIGFFLTLSLLYFGEAVWPHIILFGGALAIFMHGYDRYTFELNMLRRFRRRLHEPVL